MRSTVTALVVLVAVAWAPTAIAQTKPLPPSHPKSPKSAATAVAPENPRKPCPRYGEGFYQVPGTDTCIKISGDVRVDVTTGGR